ncbi:MAG: hypothetical protein ACXWTP_00870 [Methylosarcina sp.]
MNSEKKKPGPRPIRGQALTAAERKRRQTAKQLCLIKAAENAGYKPYQVLISDRQLRSLGKLLFIETRNASALDAEKLNEVVYFALKQYLNSMQQDFIKRGHSRELVESCTYFDGDFADYNGLMQIMMTAAELFKEWEQSQ